MSNQYIEPEYKDPGYAEAKKRSKELTTGIFDASIANAANKSAQAGSVAGVGNAGRLAANTYAQISNEKSRRISAIEDQYNNYELQHKAAFNNQNAFAKQQFEMNKPGFLDWLGFGVNTAGSLFGMGNALGLIGAGTKALKGITTNNSNKQQFYTPPPTAEQVTGINSNSNLSTLQPGAFSDFNPFTANKKQKAWQLGEPFKLKF